MIRKNTESNFNKYYLSYFLIFFLFLQGYSSTFLRLYEPINNAVVYYSPVQLSWKTSPVPGNYQVQLSSVFDFSTILKDTLVSSNSFQLTIDSIGTIYWRVRVKGSNFLTCWSETGIFNTFKPNPVLWLDGDKGVTQNGGFISQWNDQSANANNAKQSNPSLQPQYINTVTKLNNKSVMRPDGLDDYIQYNSVDNIRTVCIVFKHNTGFQDYPSFLGSSTVIDYISDAGDNLISPNFASTNVRTGTSYKNKTGPIAPTDLKKPTEYSLISIVTTGNTSSDHLSSERFNGGRYWKGEYASVMLFSDPLSDESRNKVEDFLLYKYAPPVLIRDTVVNANFCDSVLISVSPMYKSFTWSNGSTNQTTKFLANGAKSVSVTSIFDQNSQTTFSVYPYKRYENACVFLCKGQTFSTALTLPAGFSVLWLHNNSTSVTQNFNQSGQYVVKVTDAKGCFFNDTLNIIFDEPKLNPALPLDKNIRLCLNEKLFLKTQSSFDSILWSTGSADDFISIVNPGQYTVFAQTSVGCVYKDTFNVIINGEAPTAAFVTSAVCKDAATSFSDISTAPTGNSIVSWKWSFGDGGVSGTQNPNNTYTNLGNYIVSFKITTNVGCSDSIARLISVNKKPVPNFFNLLSCSGIPTTFVDQSVANAASIVNWDWDFAGLGTSTLIQNPAFNFPSAGNYYVKLTATNSYGCFDTITKSVIVAQSPVADFSFDSVCGKNPVSFQFLASVPLPNTINVWSWDFGDFETENAIKSPQHSYDSPGSYDVRLIVRAAPNQCVDTVIKTVKVFDFPVVDFTVSQTQCVGKSIQFTDISFTPDGTPMNKWNWYFSGQGTSNQQNPSYTFNNEGNYTIQLTAQNNVGCSGTKLRSIAVSSLPTPKFTFSPQNGLPPLNVSYFNQSTATSNYLWSYGDGGGFIAGYNPPPHTYTTIGTYPIQLVATDFKGCTDTLTKFILVDKAYLDGVMASITIIPNGEYYQIKATILNNSNVQITSLGLGLQLGGGAVIRETWTGSLLPGETVVYTFTGEIKLAETSQIPVVCASIENINNNSPEDRTDNNSTCKATKVGSFDILTIFPNPADANINFGVMLPRSGDVTIRFINYLGQILYNQDFSGAVGYNNFSMTTLPLASGVYVAEVYYDGNVIRQKFMRKSIQ